MSWTAPALYVALTCHRFYPDPGLVPAIPALHCKTLQLSLPQRLAIKFGARHRGKDGKAGFPFFFAVRFCLSSRSLFQSLRRFAQTNPESGTLVEALGEAAQALLHLTTSGRFPLSHSIGAVGAGGNEFTSARTHSSGSSKSSPRLLHQPQILQADHTLPLIHRETADKRRVAPVSVLYSAGSLPIATHTRVGRSFL